MEFNTKLINTIKNHTSGSITITPLHRTYEEAEEIRIAFGANKYHFTDEDFNDWNSYANYYLAFNHTNNSGLSNYDSITSVKELLQLKDIKW